jgi:hypothetical protein
MLFTQPFTIFLFVLSTLTVSNSLPIPQEDQEDAGVGENDSFLSRRPRDGTVGGTFDSIGDHDVDNNGEESTDFNWNNVPEIPDIHGDQTTDDDNDGESLSDIEILDELEKVMDVVRAAFEFGELDPRKLVVDAILKKVKGLYQYISEELDRAK